MEAISETKNASPKKSCIEITSVSSNNLTSISMERIHISSPLIATLRKRSSLLVSPLDDSKRSSIIKSIKKSSRDLLTLYSKCDHNLKSNEHYKRDLLIQDKLSSFDTYYELCETLGEGCSSVVKACTEIKTKKKFAVKVMRSSDEEKISQFKQEFFKMSKLNSEYIIKVFEMFYDKENHKLHTVMEYDEELVTLSHLINLKGSLSENTAKNIFYKLILGLLYCHSNGVCHRYLLIILFRDIKPDNLLIDMEKNKFKIIDFNVSKYKQIEYNRKSKQNILMMTHIGTLEYSAPELLKEYNEYSEQVDMWSAGAVLYFMLSGGAPFTGDVRIGKIKCKFSRDEIESSKLMLHEPFCCRNFKFCEECKNVIEALEFEDHLKGHLTKKVEVKENPTVYSSNSKLKENGLISNTQVNFERKESILSTCAYCDLQLSTSEKTSHESMCGARSEVCEYCNKKMLKKQLKSHLESCSVKLAMEQDHLLGNEEDDINFLKQFEEDERIARQLINKDSTGINLKQMEEDERLARQLMESNLDDNGDDDTIAKKMQYELDEKLAKEIQNQNNAPGLSQEDEADENLKRILELSKNIK